MKRRSQLQCLAALLLLIAGTLSVRAQGDGKARHAAVVVQYSPGQLASRCVGFDEQTISGYDLLTRAGFNAVAEGSAGLGALVCAIDGVGCDYPNEPCACQCQGGDCTYWSYTHLIDGAWRYSTLGASSYQVRDGAVDGWTWGAGSVEQGAEPPPVSYAAICGAQAAPPPPTAEPPTAQPPTAEPTRPEPSATATQPAPTATTTASPPTARPTAAQPSVTPTGPKATIKPSSTAAVASATPAPTTNLSAPTSAASATPIIAPSATATRDNPTPAASATATPSATVSAAVATPPTRATLAPTRLAATASSANPLGAVTTATPTTTVAGNPATAPPNQPATSLASYLVFGGMLAGLLGAALYLRRRRQP